MRMNRIVVVMLLSIAAGQWRCAAAATPEPMGTVAGCYASTDDIRYNHLGVMLKADGRYYAELNGDISEPTSSTGTWRIQGNAVTFAPLEDQHREPLPARVDIVRDGKAFALRLPRGESPTPSGHFAPLKARACDDIGWTGKYWGRKGAPPPIADGDYTFQHRFAEHPTMPSVTMQVRIRDRHIVVTNTAPSTPFPIGVVTEGTLQWNGRVARWIIARHDADKDATEVGGCTDGPEVVDLDKRIYWTC